MRKKAVERRDDDKAKERVGEQPSKERQTLGGVR
jgi:hypothetical protein